MAAGIWRIVRRQPPTFIIDEDAERRETLTALLARAGYPCRAFASASEFLLDPFATESAAVADALMRKAGNGIEARKAKERLAVLTPREMSVLIEAVKGNSNKIAGYNLGISPRTVEAHRARIMTKLEADSLCELVRLVIAAGGL